MIIQSEAEYEANLHSAYSLGMKHAYLEMGKEGIIDSGQAFALAYKANKDYEPELNEKVAELTQQALVPTKDEVKFIQEVEGLNFREFGELMKEPVADSTVSLWAKGETMPRMKYQTQISNLFGKALKHQQERYASYADLLGPADYINKLIKTYEEQSLLDTNSISDGQHTFGQLYDHRAKLFALFVNSHPDFAWKSKKHADGTMYDNYFIVGVSGTKGDYSYHYSMDYWDLFKCAPVEYAPVYDGHQPDDLYRLDYCKYYLMLPQPVQEYLDDALRSPMIELKEASIGNPELKNYKEFLNWRKKTRNSYELFCLSWLERRDHKWIK